MPRARIARIGEQNAVVAVHQQRIDEEERGGRPGGDDHPLGVDGDPIVIGVVLRDGRAELGKAERRRVVDVALRDRALRLGEDGRRRRKIGFTDLHVDDGSPRRFERASSGLHLHDMERRDLGNAGRQSGAGLHRKS